MKKKLINIFWENFKNQFGLYNKNNKELKETIEIEKKEESLIFKKMIIYIIKKHPLMGSKFEDIVLSKKIIKMEVLLSDKILNDENIKLLFFNDRKELFYYLTGENNKLNISYELSILHLNNILIHKKIHKNKYKYSMNISKSELISEKFINKLIKLNNKYDIYKYIQLEILEHYIDFNDSIIINNIKKIYNEKFYFIIDDYGDNFSNMNRIETLLELEKDIIKNNRQLIKSIKITGSILISILLEKDFFNSVAFKDNFNSKLSKHIYIHILNYKNRLEENGYECQQLNDIHKLNKKFYSYEELMSELSPIINKMKKVEKKLIKNEILVPPIQDLKKIKNIQNKKELEIIFEFINMKLIQDFIYKDLNIFNNFNGKILFQGRLHGESTNNILNIDYFKYN